MTDVLHIAEAIVKPAVRALIAEKREKRNRSLPLAELINASQLDDYKRRRFDREVEAIRDSVAMSLEKILGPEWSTISTNDRTALLDAVADAFHSVDLSDKALFAVDGDPIKLARSMRSQFIDGPRKAGLSPDLFPIYERLLDECCVVYVQLAIHLTSFMPRGITAILERTTALSDSVDQLLARLPKQPLVARAGGEVDLDFRRRYLSHISGSLDELDLFGIDFHRYRPRTNLSVAYISLSVSSSDIGISGSEKIQWERGQLLDGNLSGDGSYQIERALSVGDRTLIRGEAGSGKTTLLRWLAVRAARSEFTSRLEKWNGLIPFLVTLRSYMGSELPRPENFLDGAASPLVGLMPDGWVHRQFDAGNALLLVDGVDELPVGERRLVRDWIHAILVSYPTASIVVTSRPSAAAERWLSSDGFASAHLQRMNPHDIRELISHWHAAIKEAGNLPCDEKELPTYERSLLARIDANPHLQGLATSPLLCAMLCALNLDRRKALPNNRMNLYSAALEMLLERRDAERRIVSDQQIQIDLSGKLELLQHLAWRLSLNNRSELPRAEAERRLAERLSTMPLVSDKPADVLDHFTQRSGVIREPVPGRIDFIHRTFQEYLTAREAAEQGDVGVLVERAHLDSWRETVIMAAGHANKPTTHDLLTELLSRADSEPRHSRGLRLLAAACLETCGSLDSTLRQDILGKLEAMLPPRRTEEARSLSRVGSTLLKLFPNNLDGLSDAASAATVATAGLIGGPDALTLLRCYATEYTSSRVAHELLQACNYFDARDYGEGVLCYLQPELSKPHFSIDSLHQLEAWKSIGAPLDVTSIQLYDAGNLHSIMDGVGSLKRLWAAGNISDISPLVKFADSMTNLTFWSDVTIEDLEPIARLISLRQLVPSQLDPLSNIDFLRPLRALRKLWIPGISQVDDFSPLSQLELLEEIRIYSAVSEEAYTELSHLKSLRTIGLVGRASVAQFGAVAELFPALESFMFMGGHADSDYSFLAKLPNLRSVFVFDTDLDTVAGFSGLSSLRELVLDCPSVTDYSPLLSLSSQLARISIAFDSPTADYSAVHELLSRAKRSARPRRRQK